MGIPQFGFDVPFTTPTATELEYRRHTLNRSGHQAYSTSVLILLAVYILRTASSRAIQDKSGINHNNRPTSFQRRLRRLHWDLSTTYISEYGPLYIQLLAAAYILALLYIIVSPALGQPNIYMHVTKACGHVAISQIPFLYLLSVKSPYSPVTLASGLTHERLNSVHRLLGTILYSLLVCHAVGYLNFFAAKGFLAKRLGDLDVQTGLSAFTLLNVLFVASLPWIRSKWYHLGFYGIHVFVSAAVPVFIWFHVPYTRIYIGQAALIWVLSGLSRRGTGALGWSESASVRCETVGPGLIKVTCKLDETGLKKWRDHWVPGMHGYLDQGLVGPKNPFTVVAVKAGDARAIEMIVRDLGGPTTRRLAHAAKSENILTMALEGPYGEAKEYMPLLTGNPSGKIMIAAGGVGATYALPIYLNLLKARGGSDKKLRFVWFVKNKSDAQWGMELTQQSQMDTNFQLVTTRESGRSVELWAGNGTVLKSIHRPIRAKGHRDLDFLIDEMVHEFLRTAPTHHASVMLCGPSGLAKRLRAPFGRHLLYSGTHIDWYEEQFGFGGQ